MQPAETCSDKDIKISKRQFIKIWDIATEAENYDKSVFRYIRDKLVNQGLLEKD
jgi:hypothetical protein